MNLAAAAGAEDPRFARPAVSPYMEMGAYEALWMMPKASFKVLADLFREHPGAIPSDFVDFQAAEEHARQALERIESTGALHRFGVRVHGAGEYPQKLRDADHPVELLYFQGWWDLVETPSIAIVGTRHPSEEGRRRTARLTRLLVQDGYTAVSGLAAGIDTIVHRTALDAGGKTISVVGTPLTRSYPAENRELQREIADKHLIISQVPILRYEKQGPKVNRFFFPARNVTMSALTDATVIVEAGNTSGTLIQARAALSQGRKLFILDSCFRNQELTWPHKYAEKGAIRVADFDDIRSALAS